MRNSATTGLNLLIPDKPDIERDAVADAFEAGGGLVHRLGRFWDPPVFDPAAVRVYGSDSFCLVLQQKLGLALCSPSDGLLLQLPQRFLRRHVAQRSLADVAALLPAFVKPAIPKQFRGAVYGSLEELRAECRGLAADTSIVVSSPVSFTTEVRSFVLNGRVLDAAAYEGNASIDNAIAFIHELSSAVAFPKTVVVDVGFIADHGWAVIEFNATWGAGLNGCSAVKVLPAILAASGEIQVESETAAELLGAEALKYAESNLRRVGTRSNGWEIEYENAQTGEQWVLDYPQSEHHGGGPPRLRKVGNGKLSGTN